LRPPGTVNYDWQWQQYKGYIHDVMMAAQEAGLAFDLMLEVRNKLMDAYQEIMRMPV